MPLPLARRVYAGTYNGGVFVSTDGAGAWTAANTGLGNLKAEAVAVDPGDSGTGYAGTYGAGVWQLTPLPPVPPSSFYSVTPCRVLDTREVSGPTAGAPLTCGTERTFAVAGRCGVPMSAKAASLNLTGTASTAQGNLRLFPPERPRRSSPR